MPSIVEFAFSIGAGIALGSFYFTLLFYAVRLHLSGAALIPIAGLHLLRFSLAGVGFWLAAQQGAAVLLFVMLGFLLARVAVQHWSQWKGQEG